MPKLYFQDVCEGCEDPKCQECCEHCDLDSFICVDCGKEMDPGVFIDRAMDAYDLSRADSGY